MSMEHVLSWKFVFEFQYTSFALTHCNHVSVFMGHKTCSASVQLVQICMEVEIVLRIKVSIITIHYHYHFICRRSWCFGIHNVDTIQTMGYVFFQGLHMAVIWKYAKRFSSEFICESPTCAYSFKYTVHLRFMDSMSMYCVTF